MGNWTKIGQARGAPSSSLRPPRVPESQLDSPQPAPPDSQSAESVSKPIHGLDLTSLQRQELSFVGKPTSEALWCQAFARLRNQEPEVVSMYEHQVCSEEGVLNAAGQFAHAINQIQYSNRLRQLVVTIAGKPFKIRAISAKIIEFIGQSREFIGVAAGTEPHAALAWAEISLLLPVNINLCLSMALSIANSSDSPLIREIYVYTYNLELYVKLMHHPAELDHS